MPQANVLAYARMNQGANLGHDVMVSGIAIAATGASVAHAVVPEDGVLESVDFSCIEALAAHNSNYITFAIKDMGTNGLGATQVLAASDENTTKATGGTAIAAGARRQLKLSSVSSNLKLSKGARLEISFTATGTLANTLSGGVVLLRFQ